MKSNEIEWNRMESLAGRDASLPPPGRFKLLDIREPLYLRAGLLRRAADAFPSSRGSRELPPESLFHFLLIQVSPTGYAPARNEH